MNPETLASWIQTEHAKIDALAVELQEKVAVIPRAHQQQWITDVRASFDDFSGHVHRHQTLEEQDGYMTAVVEQRPTLSREVERLAHEHGELEQIMGGIKRQLTELSPDDALLIRDACRRIQNLLLYLEHHTKEENLMVMSVFQMDLGTDD
ncbi:MAG: hemerythrin domain-containing protein [Planctomycetes bacterium]|nr:hemerythrin domain-containing protein [Planctomycetota bacterium]